MVFICKQIKINRSDIFGNGHNNIWEYEVHDDIVFLKYEGKMAKAKCRLCSDVIESKHRHEYITCSCGEISIDGGKEYMHCRANDEKNFMLLDNEGNEIIPKKKQVPDPTPDELIHQEAQNQWEGKSYSNNIFPTSPSNKPTKSEMLSMLDEMIERIENLPQEARYAPVTHADHVSLMLLVVSLFRASS